MGLSCAARPQWPIRTQWGHSAGSEAFLMTPTSGPSPQSGSDTSEQSAEVLREVQEGVQGPRAWEGRAILSSCDLDGEVGHFALLLPCSQPLPPLHPPSTSCGCCREAVGRGPQAQGLWVLHISQPGRLGALMKVQEGQDQPGWGGQTTAAYSFLPVPTAAQAHLPRAFAYLGGAGQAGACWLRGSGQP